MFWRWDHGVGCWNLSSWKMEIVFFLHSQYHICWWLGNARSPGINNVNSSDADPFLTAFVVPVSALQWSNLSVFDVQCVRRQVLGDPGLLLPCKCKMSYKCNGIPDPKWQLKGLPLASLTRYIKLQVVHAPGMPEAFTPLPRDARAVMHAGIAN